MILIHRMKASQVYQLVPVHFVPVGKQAPKVQAPTEPVAQLIHANGTPFVFLKLTSLKNFKIY